MRLHNDWAETFDPRSPAAQAVAQGPGSADSCPQFLAVREWVVRRLGRVDHEQNVAAIAWTLFDLTRPLHAPPLAPPLATPLAAWDRKLLRLAAMVHDVGRCVDDARHPAEGAAMLLAEGALPLSQAERRALAYLTLYHKGPVPEAGRDAVLGPDDDARRLRLLLALLRAADALDSRSLQTPRLVFALASHAPARGRGGVLSPPNLRITCYLAEDCAKARKVYRRRKKFRLMEELLGVRVEVEVTLAHALRMVA